VLLDHLIEILAALGQDTKDPSEFPNTKEPIAFYNAYIDFAIAIYAAKFWQFYEAVATSLEDERYLIYAAAGRAILENTAMLRHYSRHADLRALREAWGTRLMNDAVLRTATKTLDRLVRGNRFSWDAFIEGRFADLGGKPNDELLSQVSVAKCLEELYKEKPNTRSLYALFCDLVHPNLGSNFMVLRNTPGKLLAAGTEGEYGCNFIVLPTLAGVIGAYSEIQCAALALETHRLPPLTAA
jgi:hypothetical protein